MEQIKEESTHDDGTEVTDEIVTDRIVTYGSGTEYDSDKKITDGVVTDGIVTDGIVTDEIGSKQDDKQIRDGKETGDTDTVAKEVKEETETEVTNNMFTGQGTEREQPVEEVPDKNITV